MSDERDKERMSDNFNSCSCLDLGQLNKNEKRSYQLEADVVRAIVTVEKIHKSSRECHYYLKSKELMS